MVSSRQFPFCLSRDPVLQKLGRRLIAERGVTTAPVVKDLDVVEQVGPRLVMRGVAGAVDPFVLQTVEKLSVGALSQQLPLRLIEQVMPNSANFSWKVPLAY